MLIIVKNAILLLLLIRLMGCATISETEGYKKLSAEFSKMEFFTEEDISQVSFTYGEINKKTKFSLNSLENIKIALLPVRSIMGGGLGEETVTNIFYEELTKKFANIKFISNKEASDTFTDMDMWEEYFEYLYKYSLASVTDFDKLQKLYKKLGAAYIISINSDYAPIPKYPNNLTVYIQVQIWNLSNTKIVWEAFAQGDDVVDNPQYLEDVRNKIVMKLSKRIADELGAR